MLGKVFSVLCLFQILFVFELEGCRWNKKQKLDEINNVNSEQNPNIANVPLKKYFFECMQQFQYKENPDIQTIVDFTIRHSAWFAKTKIQYCALSAVDCWRYLVSEYIRTDSQYLIPARNCIQQYGQDAGLTGKVSTLNFETDPPKETANKLNINVAKFKKHVQKLWIPENSDDHSLQNLTTLVSFMQEDVVCALDFCDCTGLILPPGEQCGDNWYSRISAIIKNDSPIKTILLDSSNLAIGKALRISSRSPTTAYQLSSNLTHKPPIRLPKQVMLVPPMLSDITEIGNKNFPENQTIYKGPAPTFRAQTETDLQKPPPLTYLKLLQLFLKIRSTASPAQNSSTEANSID